MLYIFSMKNTCFMGSSCILILELQNSCKMNVIVGKPVEKTSYFSGCLVKNGGREVWWHCV